MIRFSAILVAGAIAVLVAGVLATSLALVYLSIGVSVLASVLLAVGVILRRREIFGEAGAAAASRRPAGPVTPVTGTPVMVGGRARIPEPGARPGRGWRPAGRGRSGFRERQLRPTGRAGRGSRNPLGMARAGGFPRGRPGAGPSGEERPRQKRPRPGWSRHGRPVPGRPGGRLSRDARLRAGATAHRAARPAPASRAAGGHSPPRCRGARGQRLRLRRHRPRPGHASRPGHTSRPGHSVPDQRAAGTAPPGRSAGPPGPPGRPLAGAGPPAWPDPDITWQQEPTGTRRPSREPDGGWVFTPPTPPPDLPASPAEEPDAPAPAAGRPDEGITQHEPAHDRWPSRETEDRAATPPTPPERPRLSGRAGSPGAGQR